MPAIGLDLDGVIANLVPDFCRIANGRYHTSISPSDITTWDISKCTALTTEQVVSIFTPGFFFNLMPMPGAVTAVQMLFGQGWQIHLLTDRPQGCYPMTRQWLRELCIPFHCLELVPAARKSEYCKAHGVDCAVEDRPDTALALADVCKRVYLIDAPYNRIKNAPANLHRVKSLLSVAGEMERVR